MTVDAASRFEAHRALLVRHAYRMLGERAEAEDAVQDAYVKWHENLSATSVRDDRAYLRTAVTRLCLDRIRSARARREVYVGPWLPEPLVETSPSHTGATNAAGLQAAQRQRLATTNDPQDIVALADDVSFALLLALERLSALERAAFLLHDVLDVPFSEIAVTLDRSEAAVKKLASRARTHIREPRTAPAATAPEILELRAEFVAAIGRDDLAGLQRLLASDVVFTSDSGGKVPAAMVPVIGPDRVGRLLLGISRKAPKDVRVTFACINGSAGLVISHDNRVLQTLALDVSNGRIVAIYVTRNPDKLRSVPL